MGVKEKYFFLQKLRFERDKNGLKDKISLGIIEGGMELMGLRRKKVEEVERSGEDRK